MLTVLESFRELGLNENEAKVYYALIQNGKLIFSEFTKKIGLQNRSVTKALNSLIEKKLIVKMQADKRIYYIIDNPENLKNRIIDEADRKKEILGNVIGNIESTYNSVIDGKPKVIFYKGIDGLREHWQRLVDKNVKIIKQIVNCDLRLLKDTKRSERKQSKKKDRKIDVIFTSKEKPQNIPDNEVYGSYNELGELPIEIAIYKNHVMFILSKKANRPAILIEDEDIAKGMDIIYGIVKKYFRTKK